MEGFKTLGNVFVLRGVDDVQGILKATGENGKKIVVIGEFHLHLHGSPLTTVSSTGSSFIGMEVGKCLSGKNNQVTIVGMESAPLERVMGPQVGKIFQRQLEKAGVKFCMSAQVDDAKPSASDPSVVGSVALRNGENLEADLVVLGVGVAPATEYLKNSGVDLEKDGSVAVDDHWRIKGVEDAYAVGDIATYPHNGGQVRIGLIPPPFPHISRWRSDFALEHWNVAQNAGRQVGRHIANKRKPVPFTPIFWSALGAQLRYCGNTSGQDNYDDVTLLGNPDEDKWVAYYTQGERVVAVASQNFDPVVMQSAELMRRRKMLSKSDIKAGKSVLDVYPPAEIPMGA